MQVLPGIFQVNGTPYGRHQNGYLVRRNGATLLIDSGDLQEDTFSRVSQHMARWGVPSEEISHLLLTHAHYDHASHAATWQKQGVLVVASAATAAAIAAGDERCIGYEVQRPFEPCQADIVVEEGQPLRIAGLEITVHAAPGHAEGMVIYELVLDGERLWFVGDLFETMMGHRWISLPWTGSPDFDRQKYIATLKHLLSLPACDHLFPGHGPVALGGGWRLLGMAYSEALVKWR
jgi:metallo-beta-lactamase class B